MYRIVANSTILIPYLRLIMQARERCRLTDKLASDRRVTFEAKLPHLSTLEHLRIA